MVLWTEGMIVSYSRTWAPGQRCQEEVCAMVAWVSSRGLHIRRGMAGSRGAETAGWYVDCRIWLDSVADGSRPAGNHEEGTALDMIRRLRDEEPTD
jgi:hypothetical protein